MIENEKNFKVKILTYNFYLRPPPVKENEDDYKNERMMVFLDEQLDNFDIICFQEFFESFTDRKDLFINEGFQKGFHYFSESPSVSFYNPFHLIDGGLLTLSRYPIEFSQFYIYKNHLWPDSLSQKGLLYSRILINGHFIQLFNTHLQASYIDNMNENLKYRYEQIIELNDFIKDALISQKNLQNDLILLIGDLNINSNNKQGFDANQLSTIPPNYIKEAKYNEYETLLDCLSKNFDVIDHLNERYQGNAVTFGKYYTNQENQKIPYEQVITSKFTNTSNQCVDYFIQLYPKSLIDKNQLKVLQDSVKIEEFVVTGHKFTQLSDHFGVSANIISNFKE